jgi:hypothetical protein
MNLIRQRTKLEPELPQPEGTWRARRRRILVSRWATVVPSVGTLRIALRSKQTEATGTGSRQWLIIGN